MGFAAEHAVMIPVSVCGFHAGVAQRSWDVQGVGALGAPSQASHRCLRCGGIACTAGTKTGGVGDGAVCRVYFTEVSELSRREKVLCAVVAARMKKMTSLWIRQGMLGTGGEAFLDSQQHGE
ncbi:hypothetical protein BT67DRAFT_276862 [Trichocladium antarcticum]|uniref:Uncharacterized protein n=1 Tax=Trichocladium antarcticum TaxID=1450529 RepID=A0AAN6ZDV5_9PEZI|nr:hypothetical protein BT67DRAFT_276862 [Trichocladium antarcticum]